MPEGKGGVGRVGVELLEVDGGHRVYDISDRNVPLPSSANLMSKQTCITTGLLKRYFLQNLHLKSVSRQSSVVSPVQVPGPSPHFTNSVVEYSTTFKHYSLFLLSRPLLVK